MPVAHACRVLDPDYLRAERMQEYGRAAALMERMRLVLHGGTFEARDAAPSPG